MKEPLILEGIAISIDICNSTAEFMQCGDDFSAYIVVSKLAKLVEYSIYDSRCKLVRYTGDGALLFYAEDIGFSATNPAIEFSIEFINNWKRCSLWFSELRNFKIRISLDKGKVYTNEDGGLWNGLPLNIASKMKNKDKKEFDENRLIISHNVFKSIEENSFYQKLFSVVGKLKLCEKEKTIKLYCLYFQNEELRQYEVAGSTVSIVIGVLAIDISLKRLQCVLSSIEKQTKNPEMVVIVTSEYNIDNCSSCLNIRYINSDKLYSKERSYVRNIITEEIKNSDISYVCFLDGDTILAPNVLNIANNLLISSPDTVFSIPRIDFDMPLDDNNVGYITNIFLDEKEYLISYSHFSYFNTKSKAFITDNNGNITLPSYTLFISKHNLNLVGDWDENFSGWGEEDIDFTYRLFLKGCALIVPRKKGLMALHLNHEMDKSQSEEFLQNALYLLSKHPNIYEHRKHFYHLLGL